MSYVSSQYNYCTPLSSATGLTDASAVVTDSKYFTLFDNTLDGSYHPVSGNVGLWGTSLAGEDGVLPEPFVVTVDDPVSISSLSIVGSKRCFPVDFIVDFYNGDAVIYTHTVTENTSASVVCILPRTIGITGYTLTITKLSSAGVARVYQSYQSWYLQRKDTLLLQANADYRHTCVISTNDTCTIKSTSSDNILNTLSGVDSAVLSITDVSAITNTIDKRYDRAAFRYADASAITNRIDKTYDTLPISLSAGISSVTNNISAYAKLLCDCSGHITIGSDLVNMHSVMKQPSRRVYGKVHITYTDPLLNDVIYDISTSAAAHNSSAAQLVDSLRASDKKYFTLYENDLTGNYYAGSVDSQTGWTSGALSDSDGYFAEAPTITLNFEARPIINFTVHFDEIHENTAMDFTVDFIKSDGTVVTKPFTDNTLYSVPVIVEEAISEVVSVKLTITRISRPEYPATVLDMAVSSEFVYVGYQNDSNLINIDLLEELTYNDDVEALGGMSANEVTIAFDNSSRIFDFNNEASPISKQLRRNRKIRPYLGAEVIPGEIEWYSLGTYWSYKWDVPVDNLTASVIGFDTIGLLSITSYTDHQVMANKSLGELIDIVLTDAKRIFPFLEWVVDSDLYAVVIPYTWFASGSHAAALRKICEAYPMHIYCDREGRIVAAPQKLHLDYYYDVWSNDTNVIEKTYNSLYTVVPNLINVTVIRPTLKEAEQLVVDELQFDVADLPTRVLNFSAPYVSGINVDVDCDGSVQYTYKVYSWGIEFSFSGAGNVYSIKCTGVSLDTSNTATITHRDDASIRANGVVTRSISADFIQTSALASYLIRRLNELAELDKYDVEVKYRGDIALTINDPILLLDGISPSNTYNIKRHKLYWDGGLSGVANLNT